MLQDRAEVWVIGTVTSLRGVQQLQYGRWEDVGVETWCRRHCAVREDEELVRCVRCLSCQQWEGQGDGVLCVQDKRRDTK